MKASRPDCPFACPSQADIDWFRRAGIDVMALASPIAMMVSRGVAGADGRFDPDADGDRWFAFQNYDDIIFWKPASGAIVSWSGRAFALGEEVIGEAWTHSFDRALNIFADPMEWLRAKRDGIVVVPSQWARAFDTLRDVPRVAIAERLLPQYRRHMRPARLPELFVIPERRQAA